MLVQPCSELVLVVLVVLLEELPVLLQVQVAVAEYEWWFDLCF